MASISLIIPVHNGGWLFRRSLAALARSTRRPDEVIVVADGCTDGSAEWAREFGARVIEIPTAGGPAAARNRGAAVATGEILVFMDADVAFHPSTIARFEQFLEQHPDVAAVMGNYDDAPSARGLISRYKNLLQHLVHLQAPEEAVTFWGACGAIRRSVFLEVEGFDESYRLPSIEDIELGYRLRAAGHRIAHRRDILARHLKAWTMRSLFMSDVFRRAIPWTMLIGERGGFEDALNISRAERMKVAAVWAAVGLLPFVWLSAWVAVASLLLLAGVVIANAEMLRFLLRKGGVPLAAVGVGWHLFYHWYCGLGFVLGQLGLLSRRVGGNRHHNHRKMTFGHQGQETPP